MNEESVRHGALRTTATPVARDVVRLDETDLAALVSFMRVADKNGFVRGFQYEAPGTDRVIQVLWDDKNESHYIAQDVVTQIGA